MRNKKEEKRRRYTQARWLHLTLSLMMAFLFALVLLFLPGTQKVHTVESHILDQGLSFPFGTTLVRASNGLTISKSAPTIIDQGEILTYTLIVGNDTGNPFTSTTIVDILPDGVSCTSSHIKPNSPKWVYGCSSIPTADWILLYNSFLFPISFTSGTSNTLIFGTQVDAPLPDGFEIVNSNFSAAAMGNGSYSDNGLPVTTEVRAPTWEIGKETEIDPVRPGQYLTYTLTVTNSGRLKTTGPFTVTDPLPTNTDPTDIWIQSPGTLVGDNVVWVLSNEIPANGGTKFLSYAVKVTTPLTDGEKVVNDGYWVTGGNVYSDAYGSPVTVTVESIAELDITKAASSDPVQAGDLLTYTLTVSNSSPSPGPAFGVVVTDAIPANTSFIHSDFLGSTTGTTSTTASEAQWTIDSIAVDEAAKLLMIVQVTSPLTPGTLLTNHYGIDDTGLTVNNSDSPLTTTVTSEAILDISKIGLPAEVEAGGLLTYTIRYTNTGNANASNVFITDTLPISTSYNYDISVPDASPVSVSSTHVAWPVGFLAGEGDSGFITLVVNVDEPQTSGTVLTNAIAISGTYATSEAVATATNVITSFPRLDITKVGEPQQVAPGEPLTYTIRFTNTGNADATNVIITDSFPVSTTYSSSSSTPTASSETAISGGRQWTFSTLPGNGGTGTITLILDVEKPQDNGTILTNQVAMDAAEIAAPLLYTATNTILGEVQLDISKVGQPEPVEAGGLLTYTIRYTNTGNINAQNVLITDTFPANTSYVNSSPTGTDLGGTGRTWTVASLPGEGSTGEISLILQVDTPLPNNSTLSNVVSIDNVEMATPVVYTAVNTVSSAPILHVTKTANPSPVSAGGTLTYTIIYSNSGNANVTAGLLTDTLDSNITFGSATGGGSESGGQVTWTGLSIPADGTNQTVEVIGTVDGTLPNGSLLTNNVAVSDGPVNASASLNTTVLAPEFEITKQVSPAIGPLRAGDPMTYTIIYTNVGQGTANNVLITDTFPVSITLVNSNTTSAVPQIASAPTYVWSENTIAPGGGGTIEMYGTVIQTPWSPVAGQTINNDVAIGSGAYTDSDSNSIGGQPGRPAVIEVIPTPTITEAGNTIQVTVLISDTYGNPVVNGTNVSFSANPIGTVSPGSGSTTNGQAQFSLSSTVVGTTTVQAQATGETGLISASDIVTFTAGPLDRFEIQATTPQTVGVTFPITITAVDANGNRILDFNDTLTLADTTGTIAPTSVTLVSGIVVENVTVYSATSPALDSLSVTSGTLTGTTGVEIRPDVPATLTLTAVPNPIRVCQTAQVTATLVDKYYNPVPNHSISVAEFPASPVLTPTTAPLSGSTDANGNFVTAFSGDQAGGPATILAQDSISGKSGTTSITVVDPALPTSIQVAVDPSAVLPNGTATATATVTDCKGNLVNGAVVTFTNDALTTVNPVTATTVNGVATTTVTAGPTLGTATITGEVEGPLSDAAPLIITQPVLSISKAASPAGGDVQTGDTILYDLTVSNTGSGSASNVVITDVLPAGVTFVGGELLTAPGSGSGPFVSGGNVVTYSFPTLPQSSSYIARIEVSVSETISGTLITNTATASDLLNGQIGPSNVVTHRVVSTTISSDNTFLPIVLNTTTEALLADLTITGFSITPASPTSSDQVVVTVVVKNEGTAPTGEGFWVDFYVNPSTLPNNASLGADRRWSNPAVGSSQGLAWAVTSSLAPGEEIVLTSNGAGGLAPDPGQIRWNGQLPSGNYTLYAFADSYDNDDPTGATSVEIIEISEDNNISTPLGVVIAAGIGGATGETPPLPPLPDSRSDLGR